MHRITKGSSHGLADVSAFVEGLEEYQDLFTEGADIFVARAPGRLDVMGGIADYSGTLVLEMPIAEAVLAALQKNSSGRLKIVSLAQGSDKEAYSFEMPLADLTANGEPAAYNTACEYFRHRKKDHWASYVAGVFLVLMRELKIRFNFLGGGGGTCILIGSKAPIGKGVSSSAAIEVAVMNAVCAAYGIDITPRELAILCQKVENLVVGAPCGVMDQMSSNCCEAGKLLSMICQPAELQDARLIPEDISFWGIDSGVRHSVGGGYYGMVRTGAFMGYRIIAEFAGLKVFETETPGVVEVKDPEWNGYLANISPDEFEKEFSPHLPEQISGADFLSRYYGMTDTVTRVEPEKVYQVLTPTAHPVYENARVKYFAELLSAPVTEESLTEMGNLMYGSHESYSACGLGTRETDLLVELVKESKELYGAKITGGGSGGTVAVMGRKNAGREIEKIVDEYEKRTNYRPYVFSGSSMGAADFGHLVLKLGEF